MAENLKIRPYLGANAQSAMLLSTAVRSGEQNRCIVGYLRCRIYSDAGSWILRCRLCRNSIQVKAEVDPCYNARLIQTIFLFQLGYGAPGHYDGQTCTIGLTSGSGRSFDHLIGELYTNVYAPCSQESRFDLECSGQVLLASPKPTGKLSQV